MEFHAFHGCYDMEQKVGNHFVVDLEIATSQDNIAEDDLQQAVNYLAVYEIVAKQMKQTQRTIEAVCLNIIDAVAAHSSKVEGVRCEVAKMAPPLGGKVGKVSVILEK